MKESVLKETEASYVRGICYFQWDPKITTLPGLYVIATLLLSPLELCNTFHLRCLNLLATFLNLYFTYDIVKQISITRRTQRWSSWTRLLVAYNVTFFPPLFFWHFLYYTDVASVNVTLLMLMLHLCRRFKSAAFVGFLSVLIRQTNVIWVTFVAVERAFDLLDREANKSISLEEYRSLNYLRLLWRKIMEEWSHGLTSFVKFIVGTCIGLLPYATVGLTFLAFVIWNKGIVIGDRAAHVPTIHIPQLLYFSVFLFCFLWPYMIVHWKSYFNFLQTHWVCGSLLVALLTVIVHSNTLVHPYVLADNRHYVFYFWNRFMGRYEFFKYLLIPVYSFTLYTMLRGIKHLRFTTQINYFLMVSVVLIPQLLIEPRYFIIPYILYRLLIEKPRDWQIIMESVTMLTVNFAQFYIFVNKTCYWSDQPHPQRISW